MSESSAAVIVARERDKGRKPLRADARRNRDKILTAARVAFARDGADVTLESIARDAAVGIGTLYRHFPTRLELLIALYQVDLDALTDASRDTAQKPWDALVAWVDLFLEFGSTKRALLAELADSDERDSEAFLVCRAQLSEAADTVLRRAQEDGTVRADVQTADVTQLIAGVGVARGVPLEDARRLARIVLEGIRIR